ncbi:hypothetical protein HPB49_019337 [Dermacentor silvarum]|uniref:Uncharacterized protein n=1 Tax=Dermacentor silvarum TaxID=543639 RepID=A0ACB8CSR2_DERSI|nr:hypothetical protein HPB49_019337 [Dermacentor silvarum]
MSGGTSVLSLKEDDVRRFLAAKTHLGTTNLDFQMKEYCFKRRSDGIHLINIKKTWEKLLLAARAIVAIENPAEVCAISSRSYGQRAVLKFASFTGATPIAGRFTPGTFTNQHSIGLLWWMLTREVLRMRGSILRDIPWEIMVDLFFYRDPEEASVCSLVLCMCLAEKEEQAQQALPERGLKETVEYTTEQWGGGDITGTQPDVTDWSAAVDVPTFPATVTAAPVVVPPAPVVTEDWSAAAIEDWSAAPPAPASGTGTEWGAGNDTNWN